MKHVFLRRLIVLAGASALAGLMGGCAGMAPQVAGDTRSQVIISIRDQKLTVIRPDHRRITFPISTSKFGLGDRRGTYSTPTGQLEVAQKIGAGAPPGSVFRSRVRTGEIVRVDAPGRDAIVTRILALRGLEPGNRDASSRGIYIHGTPEERNIGRPSSYGCIRMRSKDIIELFELVKVGAKVQVIDTTMPEALASNIISQPPASAEPAAVRPAGESEAVADAGSAAGEQNAAKPSDAAAAAPGHLAANAKKNTKKEWAGAPSKLLAREAAVDAKAKQNKPIGSARSISNNASEGGWTGASNSHELNRSALDSL